MSSRRHPVAPLAPSLAAAGADPARLRHVLDTLRPTAIHVRDRAEAPGLVGTNLGRADILDGEEALDRLAGDAPLPHPDPHAPAKILMTSGSTGRPKAVICTHAGMTANMRMTRAVWPFLDRAPPVLVDWLPWHHAFGGTHHLHTILSLGGTLHVDDGGAWDVGHSLRNLAEIGPTLHGAVPTVYTAIAEALDGDPALARRFFARLDAMFSAGASMPEGTWHRLRAAACRAGSDAPILAGWGATETGPGVTIVHAADAAPDSLGTPLPGTTIRLGPEGDKFEMRVRSPSVTPGYWNDPDRTRDAFDEEGFYRTGDAGRLADPGRPDLGLVFDGRLVEDFKLATGTWVSVGPLRLTLLRALGPLARDLVVTGADQPALGALVWADPAARDAIRDALARHNAAQRGGSTRIARFLLLDRPPSAAAMEINEKGTINPRAVIASRPDVVAALHAPHPRPGVTVVTA